MLISSPLNQYKGSAGCDITQVNLECFLMDKTQFQTYRELVDKLLECPSGEELEILETHQNLLNVDFIEVMKGVARELESQQRQNDAYWLESFAAMLSAFIYSSQNKPRKEYLNSLNQVLQAYDDKVLETPPHAQTLKQKLNKLSAGVLRHWGKRALNTASLQVTRRIALMIENHCDRALKSHASDKTGYRLEVAIAGYETILPVFTEMYETQKWAHIKTNLGYAYSRRKLENIATNLEDSIQHLNEALTKYEKYSQRWAHIQNYLGYAYRNRIYGDNADNLEKAIQCYKKALKVDIFEDSPEEKAEIYISLGISYKKRVSENKENNLRKAIKCYQQALKICAGNENKYSEKWARIQHAFGKAHYNLGIIYFYDSREDSVDNFSLAIEYYLKSLEVRKKDSNPIDWARVQHSLGDAYRDKECTKEEKINNLKQAINSYLNALSIYNEENNPYAWAQVYKSLGNAYRKLARENKSSNFDDAIDCHKKSLTILTKIRYPSEFADASFYLGLDYFEAEKLPESYSCFKEAIEIVELLRDEILSDDDIKHKFAENWNKLYRCMVEVCIKQGKYIEAIQYVEGSKTRSLVELIFNRDIENLFPQEKLNLIKEINEKITKLQYKIQRTSNLKTKDKEKLLELRKKRDCLQNEIIGFNEDFDFKSFQSRSLQDNDCTFIQFYITQKQLIVFIFTSTSIEPNVLSFSELSLKQLTDSVASYFAAYEQQKSEWRNQLPYLLQQLSKALHLDEIIAKIPQKTNTLILVPHQYLHLLPLHALPINTSDEKDTQILMEYCPEGVFYIPSCQLYQLIKQRLNSRFHSLFAIQTPTEDLYEHDLGAIGAIKKQFQDAEILKNKQAKKSEIIYFNEEKQTQEINDKLKKADYILFFCHGKFESTSPLKSRLQLADDDLTLADIVAIDFQLKWGSLVTLAACETGLGNRLDIGDEYISLSYGFLLARSSNVISSLWTVSTSATALLIIKFYEELEKGNQIAVALNKAQFWLYKSTVIEFQGWLQQSLLSDAWKITLNKEFLNIENEKGADTRPFQSPYYWAAFRLIGKGESPMSVYESAILTFIDTIRTQCSVDTKHCQDDLNKLVDDLPEEDEDIVEKIEDWLKVESREGFLKAYRENLYGKESFIKLDKDIEMPPGAKGYERDKKSKSKARELLVNAIHEITDGNPNSSDKKP
jgi:CHAT domain-containing protein/tetratricopeptide (TPR) repeat protein